MADYLTDLKKKLSDALRDVAAKVKASPTGAAKSGAPTQSGPPVNITINVQPPKDSEDAAKTQDERVENVYIEREAAKAGFYGGSSYAKQMAARFRQAGYSAEGIGGALSLASHYASLAGKSGGAIGAIGNFGGALTDSASMGVAAIKEILPLVIGIVRGNNDIQQRIKEGVAMAPYAALKLQSQGWFTDAKGQAQAKQQLQGLLETVADEHKQYLAQSLEKMQRDIESIQGMLVKLDAAAKAAMNTALLAVSLGDTAPSLLALHQSAVEAGDYAAFNFAVRDFYQQRLKEKVGPAALKAVGSIGAEIERQILGSFK